MPRSKRELGRVHKHLFVLQHPTTTAATRPLYTRILLTFSSSLLVLEVDAKSLHEAMAVIRDAGFDPKEPPEHKPVPSQQSITPSRRRLTASMPAQASRRKLRPSFTAILWGCGMALWPRMLQHVHSHVDGDAVSVAALRMPGAAGPFVKAILEICAPLLVGYSARSLCSLLALTAFTVRLCGCAARRHYRSWRANIKQHLPPQPRFVEILRGRIWVQSLEASSSSPRGRLTQAAPSFGQSAMYGPPCAFNT